MWEKIRETLPQLGNATVAALHRAALAVGRLIGWLERGIVKLVEYLGPVAGTIYGQVNKAELLRVAVVACSSGGGVVGVLQSLSAESQKVFTDPTTAGTAAAVIVFLVELIRRLNHHDHAAAPHPGPPKV